MTPTEVLEPFNGENLTGFAKWLQSTGVDDPQDDYRMTDGMLHLGGRGMGYLATNQSYQNYHLSVEYKWGDRTDGSKYVRNSGILLHAVGPPGNARGIWMASIECQLAQGCEGDIICIQGKDTSGGPLAVSVTSDTHRGTDDRLRWLPGGDRTIFLTQQLWWSHHQVGFEERLDTRGDRDVASPLGQWTKVECICRGSRITIKINNVVVNECYNVHPSGGRILFENEKNEIFFRNMLIRPLEETTGDAGDHDAPKNSTPTQGTTHE